jgi:hypothetical protein
MAADRQVKGIDGQPDDFVKVLTNEVMGLARPAILEDTRPQSPPPIIGLGLSGGGIRSATFSLGVLQALAGSGKLSAFDYLSTVSGGGYIGSWLSAWISRDNFASVEESLARRGSEDGLAPQTAEPAPIVWLRQYSNYLAPRVGVFSIDALTLMSIWLRNVLLNLLIVIAFMTTVLLVPLLLVPMVPALRSWPALGDWAYGLGLVGLPLAICLNLSVASRESTPDGSWFMKTRWVLLTVLGPGALAAVFGSLATFGGKFDIGDWQKPFWVASGSLGVAGVAWIILQFQRSSEKIPSFGERATRVSIDAFAFVIAAVTATLIVIALLCAERQLYVAVNSLAEPLSEYDDIKLLTFGPPAFLVTFGIGGFVFVGLAGRAYYERSREWWGRLNAWFLIAGTAWFLVMATALYVPPFTRWTFAHMSGWIAGLTGLGWLGSLAASLLGPKVKTMSRTAGENLMSVLNVAAFIVIIGFVVSLATVGRLSLELTANKVQATTSTSGSLPSQSPLESYVRADAADLERMGSVTVGSVPLYWVAIGLTGFVMLLFGWRVDVNKFSLHNMYKNRLIRCYLGASRRRTPQPFTGFDEEDDLALSTLVKQRPFHILNTTLNLAQGENLAWQERKAASFVLTPLYCGFGLGKSQGDSTLKTNAPAAGVNSGPEYESIPGFRPTALYSGDDESKQPGFSLGMAMAVSGAAASPNMGASTRPALAFVMTLFNARLGRWSANPARDKWTRASPSFGLVCFLQELFGWSNERRNFVYLSDGGHFENLGLYELVRRRCSTIWIVDASADPQRNCDDLGRAIRQCRVDFGVEITLSLTDLERSTNSLLPKCGYAAGAIDYGPGHGRGTLIYIKPSLCEGCQEPDDVLAYAKREPTFPHQTTADQFFDESQFESYRRLGLYIGESCLGKYVETLSKPAMTATAAADG